MGRHVSDDEFRELFRSGQPVRISEISRRLGTSRATATRLMVRHGTCTSVNGGGLHCVLRSMCRFDPQGFYRIGGLLFYRDGNQQDAVCGYAGGSEAGVRAGEVAEFFGVSMAMQLLRLSREGRLRREKWDGSFVYFSPDEERCAEQRRRRRRAGEDETAQLTLAELLSREDRDSLELLIKVLLTCLAHPQFSAKSIALSLARRGESVCTARVKEMFERFDIVKKTPDSASGNRRSGGEKQGGE